jgi:predicted metal-dependent enzyme (double-stranded beta helix superfamily)
MTPLQTDPRRAARRAIAVADAVARAKALIPNDNMTDAQRSGLASILVDLAAQEELWPEQDFPIAGDALWAAYTLHEEQDGRYALYAVPMRTGHAQPPHDHTTWAVIAGVRGAEENVLYRRTDDASVQGRATLQVDRQVIVEAGGALVLGPTDIHSIAVPGPANAFHLHMYGLGLGHLDQRLKYDLQAGTYSRFGF